MALAALAANWLCSGQGIITTVAGNGSMTFFGDGGPATSAGMNPYGVAVDSAGNLYLADNGHATVRKVNTAGILSTVAGGGRSLGDGGPATSAKLVGPEGMVVDGAGNLYIADQLDNRVRKVDTAGIITTVAGTGTAGYSGDGGPGSSAQLNNPRGPALDRTGNLTSPIF
jgi:sugar lactone lactonase YvrE